MPQVKIVANNFMDMVASLPAMKLDRLFQNAFIFEAILRSLPPLAKKYVMHLLYLDVPVPGKSLENWVLASGVSKHKVAIDRLTQLRVFRKREVSYRLNPTFQSNIQKHIRLGYEKALAAEVLRRNKNAFEKSLDDLTDPTTNAAIQAELELKKAKRLRRRDVTIEAMKRMTFTRAAVEEALQRFGTKHKALNYLVGSDENGAQTAVEGGAGNPANDAASLSTVAGVAEDATKLHADVAVHDATIAAELHRDLTMDVIDNYLFDQRRLSLNTLVL